jgi:hypothetical protein
MSRFGKILAMGEIQCFSVHVLEVFQTDMIPLNGTRADGMPAINCMKLDESTRGILCGRFRRSAALA